MLFLVTEQISTRIGKTPDGFLACYDVPITRTGELLYKAGEVPIEPGPDGLVHIKRTPEELFRDETLRSFEGKAITIYHPESLVNPTNWKEVTTGTLQNVRGFQGIGADLMYADFLISDEAGIKYVESGELRQVSCGYDADYEQTGPGEGYQKNIIGNHVALVPNGRAGNRCAIQDSHPCTGCGKCKSKTTDSGGIKTMTFKDKFMSLFKKTLDEMKEEDLKELEKKEGTGDAEGSVEEKLDKLTKTVDALDKRITDELEKTDEKVHAAMDCWYKKTKDAESEAKKEGESEEKEKKENAEDKKTKDADSVREALSRCEVLVPGFKMPTKDGLDTVTGLASIKKQVLKEAYAKDEAKGAIDLFTHGVEIDKLDTATLDAAFIGASEIVGRDRNKNFKLPKGKPQDFGGSVSPAELNKSATAFWTGRKQ
jgi:uncharacterized protein